MLELIVLGQIPGTEVYISFVELAAGVATFLAFIAATWKIAKRLQRHNKNNVKNTTV